MADDPAVPKLPYPYRVTAKLRAAFTLGDQPATVLQKWIGYLRRADQTVQPANSLAYPSQNCIIPMKDKIDPRAGSTLLGAAYTAGKDWPIIGHKKRFTTMGGVDVEVRVAKSNDGTLNDIVQVLYPNPLTGINQWYTISAGIWGLVPNTLSAWTAVPPGLHRYYMDDWFDSNLNPAKSLNVSRLIWVNGLSFIFSWIGAIAPIVNITGSISGNYFLSVDFGNLVFEPLFPGSYTVGEVVTGGTSGATAVVVSEQIVNSVSTLTLIRNSGVFVPGETLTGGTSAYVSLVTSYTPPANTWASLGFLDPTIGGESPYININGIAYFVANGWGTNTIDVISPFNPEVSIGDVAMSYPRADATTIPLDVTKNNQNYMYYGYWKSRRLFQSNAFGHDATQIITGTTAVLNDLVVTGPYTGTGSHTYKILITSAGTPDQFSWSVDGGIPTATGVAITGAAQALSSGISITFGDTTGHTVGDSWTIEVNQPVTKAWTNFYYSIPVRKPGEGYVFQLPANFWTMEPQESQMYVNTAYGQWGYIEPKLSSDLLSETVVYTPLKQPGSSKVIYPYMIGHMDNSLIYVTENKKLDMIQRMKFLELPQIGNLSNLVQLDFDELSFLDGSVEYQDKKFWITSPHDGKMLCYDYLQKYWQAPQAFPELGILSVVGNTLINHSSIRNQSFNLYTDDPDNPGDNGQEYTVIARSPYDPGGDRWGEKNSNASFVEGYVEGAPPMYQNLYLDIDGASGIRSHLIKPVIMAIPTTAPLGEGPFGEHPFGSDKFQPFPHFFEIDKRAKPLQMQYYFLAMELVCTTKKHSYSWLTMGVNRVVGNRGNNKLLNKSEISRE